MSNIETNIHLNEVVTIWMIIIWLYYVGEVGHPHKNTLKFFNSFNIIGEIRCTRKIIQSVILSNQNLQSHQLYLELDGRRVELVLAEVVLTLLASERALDEHTLVPGVQLPGHWRLELRTGQTLRQVGH